MSEISVLDLQNLRHLIGGYDTEHCKMTDYEVRQKILKSKNSFRMPLTVQ